MTERIGFGSASTWRGRKVLVLSPTPTCPLDYGNRRRIYFLCRRIRQLGGEIHFLHYPTEEEWSRSVPLADQRRMIAEWDAYYVAPVTRRLYAPPAGADHAIDEWWDPSLGDMLSWLFQVQDFDVFVVNYVWLSKAFDFAPPGVLKIVDTHDRFSGRRAMFEGQGLAPDYFHTDEDNERTGLQRADIVWAIKSSEEAAFRCITDRPVLTLVHAEPVVREWPRSRSGVLRLGIAGSNNDINIVNFRRFLAIAGDYIRRTQLPCEIVVAGSCCDRLNDLTYPFVRRMGRLASMDAFYDEVDVVLGPMEFSTGLKVKIGEALAHAKAIVAHEHCFDGYAPTHPFHTLPSFAAMMQACRDIVRAPQLVDDLELAAIESMTRALQSVDSALEATLGAPAKIASGFVFVIALSELAGGSLVLDHVCEAALFVGHQCRILFFVDGAGGALEKQAMARLTALGRVMLSHEATAALGEAELPAGVRVTSLAELLSEGHLGFWLTFPPRRLPSFFERIPASAFVPLSVLALQVSDTAISEFLIMLKQIFAEVIATDVAHTRLLAAAAARGIETHTVPTLWRADLSETLRAVEAAQREAVTLFVSRPEGALFDLAHDVARRLTNRRIEFVYDDRPAADLRGHAHLRDRPRPIPLSDYMRHLGRGGSIPFLVVELGYSSAFGMPCELLDRAAVPRLSLFDPAAPRPVIAGRLLGRVGGVMESAVVLAECLTEEARLAMLSARGRARYGIAPDAGWTAIWRLVETIIARNAQEGFSRNSRNDLVAGKDENGRREVATEIVFYLQRQGDRRYAGQGWVGNRGAREGINAFGIRPLEALAPGDIEYKAFGPNGRETPWVSDTKLCGTRGSHVPLTGFAVRLAPHLRDRFDVVYEGSFFAGEIAGPSRNGEPCIAALPDDPLEAMHVRLLARAAA
jgi:hypothetical protein